MPQPTRERLNLAIGRAVEAHVRLDADHELVIRIAAATEQAREAMPNEPRPEHLEHRSARDPRA